MELKKKVINSIARIPVLKDTYHEYSYIKKHYREISLIDFNLKKKNSEVQSTLLFTSPKCASVYLGEVMKRITANTQVTTIDLETHLNKLNISIWDAKEHERAKISNAFVPHGYFYCPLRYGKFLDFIPNLENYKILLVLRDPRDVLTSQYFSFGFSHSMPVNEKLKENFLKKRQMIKTNNIDDYVLQKAGELSKKYRAYIETLVGRSNVKFLTYESMVCDFHNWMDAVVEFLPFKADPETISNLIQEANFDVSQENIYSHKRQVLPGDHRRKLKSETIEILNKEFHDVLVTLNYDIN
ncbi:sulfotransferase domain-containing protein [Myxosarcina sp. GI1]|uniref:sulfotransferase domain-containing protein n=1 Tax=Myxosarcina sp. GI1 TaxID=1541065 RepID=UPI000568C45A|nr:sulfotransferase domain-containing protein [Myxosarcina sp. GI1]